MAAEASTVVARVGLDDRGFQEGVAKIQRGLKLVQSEFAAASSKLGDFGKSEEGLRFKATENLKIKLNYAVAELNKMQQLKEKKANVDNTRSNKVEGVSESKRN